MDVEYFFALSIVGLYFSHVTMSQTPVHCLVLNIIFMNANSIALVTYEGIILIFLELTVTRS